LRPSLRNRIGHEVSGQKAGAKQGGAQTKSFDSTHHGEFS